MKILHPFSFIVFKGQLKLNYVFEQTYLTMCILFKSWFNLVWRIQCFGLSSNICANHQMPPYTTSLIKSWPDLFKLIECLWPPLVNWTYGAILKIHANIQVMLSTLQFCYLPFIHIFTKNYYSNMHKTLIWIILRIYKIPVDHQIKDKYIQ